MHVTGPIIPSEWGLTAKPSCSSCREEYITRIIDTGSRSNGSRFNETLPGVVWVKIDWIERRLMKPFPTRLRGGIQSVSSEPYSRPSEEGLPQGKSATKALPHKAQQARGRYAEKWTPWVAITVRRWQDLKHCSGSGVSAFWPITVFVGYRRIICNLTRLEKWKGFSNQYQLSGPVRLWGYRSD